MKRTLRPPLPLRLAAYLLPRDAREDVLGDLFEHWKLHVIGKPWPARMAWAWRQPLVAVGARLRYGVDRTTRSSMMGVRRVGLGVSWIDVKLGIRMLVKHPGVTLVVVFALGIGIPASLAPHHLMDVILETPLPFEDGERIVGLVAWDVRESDQVLPTQRDFERWRRGLSAFDALGAARQEAVTLIVEDGGASPVQGASMTATAFSITGIPPLLGRALVPADEMGGAPEVVVIGYDVWRSRLGADPDIVGRTVKVGGVSATVVGVMPEGFYFPYREQVWRPLRRTTPEVADEPAPSLWIFGRLADGVSEEEASAELALAGLRIASAEPESYGHLRPEVVPYSALAFGTPRAGDWIEVFLMQAFPYPLLLLACGNVAILLLARAANRQGEVAVRTALGASRARVVSQLFVEALVLACLATGAGLLALDLLVNRLLGPFMVYAPFWIDVGVTPELVVKALLVAAASAVVAGVAPALRATGAGMSQGLRSASTGATGIRFGKLSATLIVAEVALGVGCLFATGVGYRIFWPTDDGDAMLVDGGRFLSFRISFPESEGGGVALDADDPVRRGRIGASQRAVAERLRAEPGVTAVAIADAPPDQQNWGTVVEVDGLELLEGIRHTVRPSLVDIGFFDALDVPLLQGRGFEDRDLPSELGGARPVVVVNAVFVSRILGGRNAIGQSIRFGLAPGEPPGPAYEIVGVVPRVTTRGRFGVTSGGAPGGASVAYVPALPGEMHPVSMAIEVGDDPASFTPRLRQIVGEEDPTAVVRDPVPLDEIVNSELLLALSMLAFLGVLAAIAIVLSTAGLYALMSFTVARRTREIGIRTALGGRPEGIVAVVARRAMLQLGLGVALGCLVWIVVVPTIIGGRGADGDLVRALEGWPRVLALTSGTVVAVGLLACLVPTLRGLRIRPVEALRTDG